MQQEAAGADAIGRCHLVDHGEQDVVEADALVGDELVVVQAPQVVQCRGEKRRQDDALLLFAEIDEFVAILLRGAVGAMDDDGEG